MALGQQKLWIEDVKTKKDHWARKTCQMAKSWTKEWLSKCQVVENKYCSLLTKAKEKTARWREFCQVLYRIGEIDSNITNNIHLIFVFHLSIGWIVW